MGYPDLSEADKRFFAELAEDKELDRPRFIGCMAIMCGFTGRNGETLVSGCSRGDFKRAIKRLRESQRAVPQYAWGYENAILHIRREWLHRKSAPASVLEHELDPERKGVSSDANSTGA